MVGLIVEYWREVVSAFKHHSSEPRWKRLLSGVVIGGVFITVGVAGEMWIEFRSSRVETRLRNANNAQLASLNAEAAMARKDAAQAERDLAQANQRAAEAN